MSSPLLRPYQVEDLSKLIAFKKHGLWHEPAVGKTAPACVFTKYLFEHKAVATVWCQPKSIIEKNRRELLLWTGWETKDVVVVDGTPAQVAKALQTPAKAFLMTYARFRLSAMSLPTNVKAVIADEVHLNGFGGPDSQQSRMLRQFFEKRAEYYVPMSGTLINGKPDSAYTSINIIEPNYYGDFDSFANYHHEVDPFTGYITGYRNLDKIKQILMNHGERRTFESIYGTEAKIIVREFVEMSEKQRLVYEKFEDSALLELEKFFIDGSLPGVAFIRAKQILEHPNHFPDLSDPKSKHFLDIIDGEQPGKEARLELIFADHINTGKPLVVFSTLVPQQESIFKLALKMGLTARLLNGSSSKAQRDKADEEFRAGDVQVLVCSPHVAGVGLNWDKAGGHEVDHCVFASMDYQDSTFFQAYRRFIRGKRTTPLKITILCYRDAKVEERTFDIIERKSRMANTIDETREVLTFH